MPPLNRKGGKMRSIERKDGSIVGLYVFHLCSMLVSFTLRQDFITKQKARPASKAAVKGVMKRVRSSATEFGRWSEYDHAYKYDLNQY